MRFVDDYLLLKKMGLYGIVVVDRQRIEREDRSTFLMNGWEICESKGYVTSVIQTHTFRGDCDLNAAPEIAWPS